MSVFYWLPTNHDVRNFNKHAGVDLIRFAGKGLSRADLAEEMGLTRAAVTIIVNDLIAFCIIIETESRTTSRYIGIGVAQVGDLLTTSIRQAVRARSLRASEHAVKITTAMLGRRSSLIGALVQAINVAIHETIEQKSSGRPESRFGD